MSSEYPPNDEQRRQMTIDLSRIISKNLQSQSDSLTSAVERYIKENPEKYATAQFLGEQMMNKSYNLKEGVDEEGDKLRIKFINEALDNGITFDMLDDDEKELYVKFMESV